MVSHNEKKKKKKSIFICIYIKEDIQRKASCPVQQQPRERALGENALRGCLGIVVAGPSG